MITDNFVGHGEKNQTTLPKWLIADLRTDHAGESGAVSLYRGVLASARSEKIRSFASAHLDTEEKHLLGIEALIPVAYRSRLLPLWRGLGFSTGYIAGFFGAHSFYPTIVAVETFVDHHYQDQIRRLASEPAHRLIRLQLEKFRSDEINHKNEAAEWVVGKLSVGVRFWCALVNLGSQGAVALSRRF